MALSTRFRLRVLCNLSPLAVPFFPRPASFTCRGSSTCALVCSHCRSKSIFTHTVNEAQASAGTTTISNTGNAPYSVIAVSPRSSVVSSQSCTVSSYLTPKYPPLYLSSRTSTKSFKVTLSTQFLLKEERRQISSRTSTKSFKVTLSTQFLLKEERRQLMCVIQRTTSILQCSRANTLTWLVTTRRRAVLEKVRLWVVQDSPLSSLIPH
jgi:hypothetical protein